MRCSGGGKRGDHRQGQVGCASLVRPIVTLGAAPRSSPPARKEWRNARRAAGACLKAFKDSGRKGQHKGHALPAALERERMRASD